MKGSTAAVDVCRVRERPSLGRTSLQLKFGFSAACVRNWEQGRNRPAGAARILLAGIERSPQALEEAIRALRALCWNLAA